MGRCAWRATFLPAKIVLVPAVYPTRYLNGRTLSTTSCTASRAPQHVARSVGTPPHDERRERRRRAMLAPLAVDPQPWQVGRRSAPSLPDQLAGRRRGYPLALLCR